MKYLINFLILFISLSFSFNLKAQKYEHKLFLKAQYSENIIKLRWDVSDVSTWKKANSYGYTLIRETIEIDGIPLSHFDISQSIDTLLYNQKPLPFEEWNNLNSNLKIAARELLYNDTLGGYQQPGSNAKFSDAVLHKEREENRYEFSLALAGQDFNIATALSLGYEDREIKNDHIYRYYIKVLSDTSDIDIDFDMVEVNTKEVLDLPVPVLSGYGTDSSCVLKWELPLLSSDYSSYRIERKTSSSEWVLVNEAPFIYFSQIEDDPLFAYFTDSLADNTTEYIYRIAGYTLFGEIGPYSDTIHITGKFPRLNFNVSFDKAYESSDGKVVLKWNTSIQNINPEIEKISLYNVYRSKEADSKYVKLNGSVLHRDDTLFIDSNPLSSAYYTLESFDIHGYQYFSYPFFVQLSDSIPPAIPVGLFGNIDNDGKVNIGWTKVADTDLEGYRVYYSNNRDSASFIQQSKITIVSNSYYFYIDPGFELDTLYIKVRSQDWRSNYSDFSEILALVRPDLVAPSNPILLKATGLQNGINIEWRLSNSDDLAFHELWRKPDDTPDWVLVKRMNRAESDTADVTFIDTIQLDNRIYQYQLLAIDDAKNSTPSNILKVRPFVNMERGSIYNFVGYFYCNANSVTLNNSQNVLSELNQIIGNFQQTGFLNYNIIMTLYFNGMITAAQANQYNQMTPVNILPILNNLASSLQTSMTEKALCGTILGWDYKLDSHAQLEDVEFKIYRGVIHPGDAVSYSPTLYKTVLAKNALLSNFQYQSNISLDFPTTLTSVDPHNASSHDGTVLPQFVFVDNQIERKYTYLYKIMAEWKDGGYSKLAEPILIYIGQNPFISTGSTTGN